MRAIARIGTILAAGALAVAVPAAAKPTHPTHPTHPAASHKCTTHNVAYIASGTVVSWSPVPTGSGPYTGTLTVDVTRANHHAKGDKGNPAVPYTLTNAKVTFGQGVTPPGTGDPVNVIGKIAVAAKKCTMPTGVPVGTVTIRKVVVHAPKS